MILDQNPQGGPILKSIINSLDVYFLKNTLRPIPCSNLYFFERIFSKGPSNHSSAS
jgi:hypothetical protein